MQTALVIFPNFLLILIGFVLSRRFDYGRGFWDGLEKIVYYVFFPALLFRSLAVAQIDLDRTGKLIAVGVGFTLVGIALSWLAKPLLRVDRLLAAQCMQCGYRFSTYIALAVAGSLHGNGGVATAAIVLGVMIPIVNFAAVAQLTAANASRGFLAELVANPLIVSTLAGFAWNALHLPLPGFADQTLSLLGQTALPAGLLAVGAGLKTEEVHGPLRAHAWWLTVKLALVPLAAVAMLHALGIGGADAGILLLCAALPTASTTYILAVRMTGDGRAVATQVTVGTLISMLTIPAWMAWVATR